MFIKRSGAGAGRLREWVKLYRLTDTPAQLGGADDTINSTHVIFAEVRTLNTADTLVAGGTASTAGIRITTRAGNLPVWASEGRRMLAEWRGDRWRVERVEVDNDEARIDAFKMQTS